uniref:Trematode PH-like domain-containing protein n=1 Tax=Schistosoma haematobium TaxID=6185 RepID=A0A095BYS3_SCHHA
MSLDHTRKRSNSLVPRIVENLPNDPVTGQSILFRTIFKGRDHTKIIDPAGFCDNKASQLLIKHLRKKRNYGYVYCLIDRMRFERRSRSKLFRNQIFYHDIKYIYFFSNLPNVFMLALNDEKERRVYETYSVNSMEDRNRIAELTQNKNSFGKLRTSITSQMVNYRNDILENGHISLEGEDETEVSHAINSPTHQSYSKQQNRSFTERTPSPTDYFVMQYHGRNLHNNQTISTHSPFKYNADGSSIPITSSEPLLTNTPIREDCPIYFYVQRRPSKPEIHMDETTRIIKSPSSITIYR